MARNPLLRFLGRSAMSPKSSQASSATLIPVAVHVNHQVDRTLLFECASPQAIYDEDDGSRRKEGLPAGGGTWECEYTHVWAQRLRSSWGPHWRCAEIAKKSTGEPKICKKVSLEIREKLVQQTVWNITDLGTGTAWMNDANLRTVLGCAFEDVMKLDITLRLPLPMRRLPRQQKLSRLRIWLYHDAQDYWANVKERIVLEPVMSSLEGSDCDISFHLPLVNPRMEDPNCHFLNEDLGPKCRVIRRVRQRRHGYVNGRGRLLIKERGDFPLLDVGSYPFEDFSKEALLVVERKLWKQGFDVQHELIDGGSWVHEWGPEWSNYIELGYVERGKVLGRS
ncbi:hypothetical protein EK21DRAFT_95513 [Setomelanomma holmii]|uniref:Uncharacterized protein n=1 Tax=Setomelanomma holmii TaxID=210430 RepID=A0A9P4GVE2_9PLEO|nr:hypothetical protein EK21DRAFT_95513 [Setomelanomma holmii]